MKQISKNKMIKKISILTSFLFFGFMFCGKKEQTHATVKTITVNVNNIEELKKYNWNFCNALSVEITGLYPVLKKLPNLQNDNILVKSLLLQEHFTQVDSGAGNWEKGPRFLYIKYKKDNCVCKVFKKYYFYNKIKPYYNLRLSERIICNRDKFMDE